MNATTANVMTGNISETAPAAEPAIARKDPWKFYAPMGIVLYAVVLRAWLLFSIPLVPGMNGAYYLVQARSILLTGHLGIPDLPLTFYIQAAFAKLIQLVSGISLEQAVVLAVKLEDAVLPALVALPVYALVKRWTDKRGAGIWLPLFAAFAVAAGAPALSMVGDFQKNELGLVWMASLLWSLHVWLDKPDARRGALVVLFLGLAGLTHIGVFGWCLALTVFTVGMGLLRGRRETLRRVWPWLLVGGGVCALVAGVVLWKFDPQRVERLTSAITHPVAFLGKGNDRMPGGLNGLKLQHPDFGNNGSGDFRPPRDGQNPLGMGRGGMPGMPFGMMGGHTGYIFCGIALVALLVVGLGRKVLSTGDVALVTGCALGLLVLSGPWVTGDKVMRFALIAVSPAVICAAFILVQFNLPRIRTMLGAVAALFLLVPGVLHVARGGHPIISQAAADELQTLSANVTSPETTLIVARHGLEWWTAWYLHTHIAHENVLTAADWTKFDHVYFLRQKGGMMGGPGGPRGLMRRPDGNSGDLPPRPEFAGGFPPDDRDQRPFPPRGPGMGGAMGEPAIPRNADIVHNGQYFTLALVPEPAGLPVGQTQSFRPSANDDAL